MKSVFTLIASRLLIVSAVVFGASSVCGVEPLGINLERYEYPFPVAWHAFSSQGQALRMAYMDIHPGESNGRTVVLLHGKNFCGLFDTFNS